MNISQYLTIANTTGIDANARIDLNTEGGVSAVGTNMVGRLGERIVRKATDEQHYTQIRQNFLDSLMKLYGVEDQSGLPKMVLDAFKDEEVVCGKPLTKRRVTAVLDAVRRHLDYSTIHELSRGVAEHEEALAIADAKKKKMEEKAKANGEDVTSPIEPNDDERLSFLYPCDDDEVESSDQESGEENGEAPGEKEAKPEKSKYYGEFEIVEHEKVAGPSLTDRIREKSSFHFPTEREHFAANISGKFVGPAADNLMKRFDKFMAIFDYFINNSQQTKDNYVIDWLERMHEALTASRKGNDEFANKNVVRPGVSGNESIFLSSEQMDGAKGVAAEAYSLDEAIGILQKWKLPEVAVPKEDSKVLGEDDDYDNKSELNGSISPLEGFDLENEKPVFDMEMALSFNDPKLTKKVLEGAKKFETHLRAEAKDKGYSKAATEEIVRKAMDIFKGKGAYLTANKDLGELWTVSHQRLEHPENKEEFEKEMSNLRSVLLFF